MSSKAPCDQLSYQIAFHLKDYIHEGNMEERRSKKNEEILSNTNFNQETKITCNQRSEVYLFGTRNLTTINKINKARIKREKYEDKKKKKTLNNQNMIIVLNLRKKNTFNYSKLCPRKNIVSTMASNDCCTKHREVAE